ncbi:MAG TPA: HD-GYP domain-containing protein [Candidatus Dormibacteraeota bacterium]
MRWRRRPVLGAAVRALVAVGPVLLGVAASTLVARLLSVPPTPAGTALWWAAFLSILAVTWLLCHRLLRRLLPLATLLELSLLFPDSAPSRFAVLRRQANPRRLHEELVAAASTAAGERAARAQKILELTAALAVHDSRTRGHSERVRMFTDLVAREIHLPPADADRLRWAALLHAIGKLSVSTEILNKRGCPDEQEWQTIRTHPVGGYELIAPLHEWLGDWAKAVRDHHERYDGTGYPAGLRRDAISLGGRIVAVTDSYETMTAARPYKSPMSVGAARQELVRSSGSQFDPAIVRAFLQHLSRPALARARSGGAAGTGPLCGPGGAGERCGGADGVRPRRRRRRRDGGGERGGRTAGAGRPSLRAGRHRQLSASRPASGRRAGAHALAGRRRGRAIRGARAGAEVACALAGVPLFEPAAAGGRCHPAAAATSGLPVTAREGLTAV